FYPWRAFASESLHHGFLPLWNPHQFCGTPFVANSQSAVFYPLNILFYVLPTPTAFGVSALMHLMLTGLLMFGFLRFLGLGRVPALLGAVVWQISAWQVVWLALPTFLCVSAWLPLALWLMGRWAARPTAARAAALGASLGVMLLAGHLQIALYCLMLTLGYGLFCAWPAVRMDKSRVWPLLWGAAFALLLAGGLAAPQLLPAVELSRVSHRAGGAPTWQAYTGYVSLAMPPLALVTLFLPGFYGNPTQGTFWLPEVIRTNGGPGAFMENACYLGVLALGLACIGAITTWRNQPATRFFAVSALLALLLALGTPLNALLFFGIPGFAQSGSPGRILVLWTFCAAMLAATGANALLEGKLGRGLFLSLGVLLLTFLLTLGGTLAGIGRGEAATNLTGLSDQWRLPAGILLGGVAVCLLWRRKTLSTPAFGALLVGLVATDLLAANIGFNRTTAPANVYPITPGIAFLQRHAAEGRVMPLNRQWSLFTAPPAILPPNAATVYGLSDTQGYDSLLTGRYFAWASELNGDGQSPAPRENGNMVFTRGYGTPKAREAAARFVVSLGPLPSAGSSLKPVFSDGTMQVYEDLGAMPRGHLAAEGQAIPVQDVSPTRLRLQVNVARGGEELIVADQWYPGWRAWVNGRPTPILARPDVFRTVELTGRPPDAKGTVEMRYLPTSFRVGLYGLCLALVAIVAVIVVWKRTQAALGAADTASAGEGCADAA
ncbi:MAG: YfhO family protein, partial [Armatimonadota bacterium]|nr:YfhO family protein [Armatimonadota bacterium]